MKWLPIAAAVAVALLSAGCGTTRTVTVTVEAKTAPGAPRDVAQFGYIKSLTRKGARFELRFDPAFLLSGETARRAAFEDTGSADVPNDFYRVDEGHRLLTYLVPAGARVSVLSRGVDGTPITVAQLAELVAGGDPLHHKLFEPLESGFWVVTRIDTVRSLDQQYFP